MSDTFVIEIAFPDGELDSKVEGGDVGKLEAVHNFLATALNMADLEPSRLKVRYKGGR